MFDLGKIPNWNVRHPYAFNFLTIRQKKRTVLKAFSATKTAQTSGYFILFYLDILIRSSNMYKKSKSIAMKSSSSHICNNLTVLNNAERGSLNYASIHKSLINMVSTSTDGSQVTHKQVICKEPSATQQSSSMIMEVMILVHMYHWITQATVDIEVGDMSGV